MRCITFGVTAKMPSERKPMKKLSSSKVLATIATAAYLFTSAEVAFGFVHSQLLIGTSDGKFDGGEGLSGNYRTSEVTASFQFDYFPPQVPVTFGLFIGHKNLRIKETGSVINRADHWSLGPELMTWYPAPLDLKPYLKAGLGFGSYTAMEAGAVNGGSRAWYASFARRGSLGLKWDKYQEFAPLFEYLISEEELENEGSTADLSPKKSSKLKSNSILFGFESSF
jgi:hypothetical protein